MDILEVKKDHLVREYEVKVPASLIDQKVSEQIEDYAQNARIPGFRKGALPKEVAAKRFGSSLRNEIIKEYASDVIREIVSSQNIAGLASEPQIKTDTSDEGFVKYNISFEVQPDVPAINLSTVEVKLHKVAFTDKDVDAFIEEQFNENNTKWVDSTKPIKDGDRVQIKYTTKIRNKVLDRDVTNYIKIGDLEKFDKNFIGKKVGETICFDYEYKEGSFLNYTAEVLAVSEKSSYGKIDDEYAVSQGFKDYSELKEKTSAFMEMRFKEIYDFYKVQAIRKVLLECLPSLEAPDSFVKMEMYLLVREFSAGRINIPELEVCKTDEEKNAALLAVATKNVKVGLIIRKIGVDNNIKVSEKEIRKYAEQRHLQLNQNTVQSIETTIFEDKVFAKIESMIKIEDKEISFDEFRKLEGDDAISTALEEKLKKTRAKKTDAASAATDGDAEVKEAKGEKEPKEPKPRKKSTTIKKVKESVE